ncbi:MbeD/MobD family mobilization/exclusion protein, partial [Klebsiella pneumoniae]
MAELEKQLLSALEQLHQASPHRVHLCSIT